MLFMRIHFVLLSQAERTPAGIQIKTNMNGLFGQENRMDENPLFGKGGMNEKIGLVSPCSIGDFWSPVNVKEHFDFTPGVSSMYYNPAFFP
jgi:hypothetical protein